MKILIEGEHYPVSTLQTLFDDPKFYAQDGDRGKILSVGYYHSFEKKQLVYMLPKVFMINDEETVFGNTKDELLNISNIENIKHKEQFNWVRLSSVYFYNSLLEYRKRINNSTIINTSQTVDLNTNIGEQEYTYLDLLLSFVNFYKKNKNHILYKHIEFTSNQVKKPKWEKTIRNSLPFLSSSNTPVYLDIRNNKKIRNTEEELIVYYFSILNHFNQEHNLFITIDKSYKVLSGSAFLRLQRNGLSRLRKIKYRYFNDTLKRMYHLCEIYFHQTDVSSSKRKRDEFLSINNYNLVFEDMVDKLFSGQLNNDSLNELKQNDDGKIIDHIYDYQSLIDTSNIFYIGDSKYYKSNNTAGKLSKYKQFTYAKNIIQFNIDLLNNNNFNDNIRYRDEVTEGYNITPNFFIYGYIKSERNFDEHLVKRKGETITSFHYKFRLFDRDTLFVHQYKINFLYVLKAYSTFNKKKLEAFRDSTQLAFRNNFVRFFNDSEKCGFEFFKSNMDSSEYASFIEDNFKRINGRCYINNSGALLLAKHKDEYICAEIMNRFSKINIGDPVNLSV